MWCQYRASLIAQLVMNPYAVSGDPGLVPGSGGSPEEGISYSLQYFWASLVSQLVKPACNVGDLGCEDPLEKRKATHSSILA